MSESQNLAKQMRNIGPQMAQKMLTAGIDTPEKLKKIGAKKAYLAMYATGDSYGDHNAAYLHALEGAIRDCDWKDIPEELKQEYREYAQKLQAEKNHNGSDKNTNCDSN